jgi:hypothetical protein
MEWSWYTITSPIAQELSTSIKKTHRILYLWSQLTQDRLSLKTVRPTITMVSNGINHLASILCFWKRGQRINLSCLLIKTYSCWGLLRSKCTMMSSKTLNTVNLKCMEIKNQKLSLFSKARLNRSQIPEVLFLESTYSRILLQTQRFFRTNSMACQVNRNTCFTFQMSTKILMRQGLTLKVTSDSYLKQPSTSIKIWSLIRWLSRSKLNSWGR